MELLRDEGLPVFSRPLLHDEGVVFVSAKAQTLPTQVKHLTHYAVVPLPYNGGHAALVALSVRVHSKRSLLLPDVHCRLFPKIFQEILGKDCQT
jgi:hypothetical protein